MSWAADEWKVGLTHRALQKVEQLEEAMNRAKKEAEIKQFKMDSMEQVIQKEKRRVDEEKSQVSALKREVQSVSESCQDVEQKRQKLAAELHTRESTVNALNGQITHLKKSLDQEKTKVSHLQSTVEKFEFDQMGQGDKYERLHAEHEKMKNLNQHHLKDIAALRTECTTLKQKFSDMENRILSLQNENDHMRMKLQDQSDTKKMDIKNVNEMLKVEKENLKLLEKKSSEEIKQLKNTLENREREINKVKSDAKASQDKLANMLKTITVEVQNLKEAKNRQSTYESQAKAKLDQEIGELKNTLAEKEQENAKLTKDVKFLRDSLTNAQTSSESLKTELKNKESAIAQDKDTIDKIQKDMDKQVSSLSQRKGELEERLKSLHADQRTLQDEKTQLVSDLESTKHELNGISMTNRAKEDEIASLEKKIAGLEEKRETLGSTLKNIKIETEKIISENANLKAEIHDVKAVLSDKEKDISELKSLYTHAENGYKESKEQLKKLKDESKNTGESLRQLIHDSEAKVMTLEEEMKIVERNLTSKENKIVELNAELQKGETKLSEQEKRCEEFELSLREMVSSQELTKHKLKESENMIANQNKEYERLKNNLQKCEEQLGEEKCKKQQCEKLLEEVTFKCELTETNLTEVTDKLNMCQKDLSQLKEKADKICIENVSLSAECSKYVSQIETLQMDIEAKDSQCSNDQSAIMELNDIVTKLKDDIRGKEQAITDIDSKYTVELDNLKFELSNKEASLQEVTAKFQETLNGIETIRIANKNLESMHNDMLLNISGKESKLEEISFFLTEAKETEKTQSKKLEGLNLELNTLKDLISEKEKKIEDISAKLSLEIEEMTGTSREKDAELQHLNGVLENKKKDLEELQTKLEDARCKEEESEQRKRALELQLNEFKTQVEDFAAKETAMFLTIEKLNEELNRLKDILSSKEAEHGETIIQLRDELESTKSTLEEKLITVSSTEQELNHKKIDLEKVTKEAEKLKEEYQTMTMAISKSTSENDELKATLDDIKQKEEKHEVVISQLTGEINSLKDKCNEQMMAESENKTKFNQQIIELEQDTESKATLIATLQASLSQSQSDLAEKSEKLERILSDQKEIELELETTKEITKRHEYLLETYEIEKSKLQSVISKLNEEVSELKDKVSDQEMDASVNEAKLTQELKHLQSYLEEKDEGLEKLSLEVEQFKSMSLKRESEIDSEKLKNQELEGERITLLQRSEELAMQVSELQKSLEQLQTMTDSQNTENKNLKDSISELQAAKSASEVNYNLNIENLQSDIIKKDEALVQLQKETDSRSEMLENKCKEASQLKSEVADMASCILNYEREIDELKCALNDMNQKEEKHITDMSRLNGEIISLKDELNDNMMEGSANKAKYEQQIVELEQDTESKAAFITTLKKSLSQSQSDLVEKSEKLERILSDQKEIELELETTKEAKEKHEYLLETYEIEKSKLQSVISKLNEEVSELKDKVSDQEMDASVNEAKLTQDLKHLQSVLEEKDEGLAKLSLEVQQFKSVSLKRESEIDNEKLKNQELEGEKFTLLQRSEELAMQVSELQKSLEQLQTMADSQNTENKNLKDSISELQAAKSTDEVNYNLNIENLQSDIIKKDEALVQLQKETDSRSEMLENKCKEASQLKSEVADMASCILNYEREIDELKCALNDMNQKEEKHITDMSRLNGEIISLKDELNDNMMEGSANKAKYEQQIVELEQDTESKAAFITTLKKSLSQSQSDLVEKSEKLERILSDQKEIELELETTKEAKEKHEYLLDTYEIEKSKLQSVISKLNEEVSELKDKVSDQEMDASVNEAKLTQELKHLQSYLEEKDEGLEKLSLEVEQFKSVSLKRESEIDNEKLKNQELEGERITLLQRSEELAMQVSELQKSLEQLQTMADSQNTENKDLKDSISELQAAKSASEVNYNLNIENLQSDIVKKDEALVQLQKETDSRSEMLENKCKEASQLKSEVADMASCILNYEREIDELKCALNDTKQKEEKHVADMSRLNGEIISLKDELNDNMMEGSANKAKYEQQIVELEQDTESKATIITTLKTSLSQSQSDLVEKSEKLERILSDQQEIELELETMKQTTEKHEYLLDTYEIEKSKLQSVISKLNEEVSELKDKVSDQEMDASVNEAKLTQELKHLQSVLEEKDEGLEKLSLEVEQFKSMSLKRESEIDSEKLKNQELEGERITLLQRSQELAMQVSELQKSLEQLQTMADSQNTENKNLKDSISELQAAKSASEVNYNLNIENLQSDIVKKDEALVQLQKETDSRSEMLENKYKEASQLKSEVADMTSCVLNYDREIDELKCALNDTKQKEEKHVADMSRLNGEIISLKDELNDNMMEGSANKAKYEQQIVELEQDTESKAAIIATLKTSLSQSQSDLVEKSEKLERILSDQQEIELELETMKQTTEKHEHLLETYEIEKSKLQLVISKLNEEISELKDKVSDQEMDASVNEAKLTQELKHLQSVLEGKDEGLEKLSLEVEQFKSVSLKRESEIDSEKLKNQELEGEKITLLQRSEELALQVSELQKSLEQLQTMTDDYNAENKNLKDSISELQVAKSANEVNHNSNIENLQSDIAKKDAALVELQKETDSRSEMLENKCKEASQLKSEVADMASCILKYEREIDELKCALNDMKQKREKQVADISQLNGEIIGLKDELNDNMMEGSANKAKYEQQIVELEQDTESKATIIATLKTSLSQSQSDLVEKSEKLERILSDQKGIELEQETMKETIKKYEYLLETNETEKSKLQSIISKLNEEISELKDKVSDQEMDASVNEAKLTQDLKHLQSVLEGKDEGLEKLSLEVEQFKSVSLKRESEIDSEKQKNQELEGERITLLQRSQELAMQVSELQKSLEQLLTMADSQNTENKDLKDSISELQAAKSASEVNCNLNIENLKSDIVKKDEALVQLQKETDSRSEMLENKGKEASQLHSKVTDLEYSIQKYKTEIGELELALSELKAKEEIDIVRMQNLEEEKAELKDVLLKQHSEGSDVRDRLQKELENSNSCLELKEKEMENLQNELSNVNERLKTLMDSEERHHAYKVEQEQIMCEYKLKISFMESELNEDVKQNLELSQKVSELESQNLTCGERLTTQHTEVENLKMEMKEMGCNMSEMQQECDKYKKELNKSKEQLASLKSDIVILQDEIARKSSDLESNNYLHAEQLQELISRDAAQSIAVKELKEELGYKDEELQCKSKAIAALEEDFTSLKLDCTRLQSELENHQQEKDESCKKLHSRIQHLEHQVDDTKSQILRLEEEKFSAEQKLHKKDSQLQVSQNDCEEMSGQIQVMEKRLERLEKENGYLEKTVTQLNGHLTTLDMEKSSLVRQMEEKQNIIYGKEQEIKSLTFDAGHHDQKLLNSQEQLKLTQEKLKEAEILIESMKDTEVCNKPETEEQQIQNEIDCSNLSHKNILIETKFTEVENDYKQQNDILANEQNKYEELQTEADILSADLIEVKQQLLSVTEERDKLSWKLEGNGKEIESLKQQIQVSETEIENLKLLLSVSQQEFSDSEKSKKDQENEICRLQSAIERFETTVRNIETEKEDLKGMLEFTVIEGTQKEDKILTLENDVSVISDIRKELEEKLSKLKIEYHTLLGSVSEKERLVEMLETEKETLKLEMKDMESKKDFSNELENLQKQLREKEVDIDNFKDMMESLEFENSSLEAEKVQLEKQLTATESEKNLLQSDLANLKQNLSELTQKFQEDTHALRTDMSEEQNKNKNIVHALNIKIQELNDVNASLSNSESILKQMNEEMEGKLKASIEKLKNMDLYTDEMSGMQLQVQSVTGENIELQQKLSIQEKEKGDLLSQFLLLEDMKYNLEKDKKMLQEQLSDLSEEKKQSNEELALSKHKLETANQNICHLESKLDMLKSEHKQLEQTNIDLAGSVESLTSELSSSQRENEGLKKDTAKHSSLLNVVKNLRQERTDVQDKLITLENLKVQQEDVITGLQSENDSLKSLKDQANCLQTEMTALKQQLEEAEGHKVREDQLQAEMVDIKVELTTARKEASEYLNKYNAITQRYTTLEQDCARLQQLLSSTDKMEVQSVRIVKTPTQERCKRQEKLASSSKLAPEQNEEQMGLTGQVVKRLKGSSPVITKLTEDAEKTPKRKSPRLSRQRTEESVKTIESKLKFHQSSSLITKTNKQIDSKDTNDLRLAAGTQIRTSVSASNTYTGKSDPKPGPKGLRRSVKPQTTTFTNTKPILSVHIDSESSSLRAPKAMESTDSGREDTESKLLSTSSLHSMSKMTSSSFLKKNALGTITNSPVKTTTAEATIDKIAGPQRTLNPKKSPQIRTRRRVQEEQEEQNSQNEAAPECKVA